MKKETVYVDIDDDITGIIDRVISSKQPIVAAVLPKRAAMLHSSVNMRLLKKAADDAGKRLVLITSEASVLKLAALTRVHVAKSLTSKPALPEEPAVEEPDVITTEETELTKEDKKKSVGELLGDKPKNDKEKEAAAIGAAALDDDVIELDNLEEAETEAEAPRKLTKKEKKLKVPSFDKFRNRLFIFGGLALAVIVFLILAIFVWPRATIAIETERNDIETQTEFTAKVGQENFDEENRVLPAELKKTDQTLTQKFTATGKKDVGNKASGTMNVTNCINDGASHTLPAGTTFSSGDYAFATTESVLLEPAVYSGQNCRSDDFGLDKDVPVRATEGGDGHNLSARAYTSSVSGIEAFGSAMSGGTTKVVTVVSAQDIADAKQKIEAKGSDEYKTELQKDFTDASMFALLETFTAKEVSTTSAPGQDEEADEATLSVVFSYQMLGVKKDDIDKVLARIQESKIDTSKQRIYDNGLGSAIIGQLERPKSGEAKLSLKTTGVAGPQLDAEAIAREVAGKSGGDTKQLIEARPGISSVEVRYDPFWVFSTPKKLSRIHITFDAAEN